MKPRKFTVNLRLRFEPRALEDNVGNCTIAFEFGIQERS
jgi:hypothetical protein